MRGDYYEHESDTVPNTIWHRLNRFLSILLVVGIIIVVICKFLPELQKQKAAQAEEAHLKLLIKQRQDALARKTKEINWLMNDPTYVEIIARDRLDLMKEGETIYRLDVPKSPHAAAAGQTGKSLDLPSIDGERP